jgi:hypothetical protein
VGLSTALSTMLERARIVPDAASTVCA